jgi:hypothetical protein
MNSMKYGNGLKNRGYKMTQYKNGNGKRLSLEEKIDEVEKAFKEFESNGAAKKVKCNHNMLISKIEQLKILIEESV